MEEGPLLNATYELGFFKVTVTWKTLNYYEITGFYNTYEDIDAKIEELRKTNMKYKNVKIEIGNPSIYDGEEIIGEYFIVQNKNYIRPLFQLPILRMLF